MPFDCFECHWLTCAVPCLAEHKEEKAVLVDEVLNVALHEASAHLFNMRMLVERAQMERENGMKRCSALCSATNQLSRVAV
jgi:hypothetical protein